MISTLSSVRKEVETVDGDGEMTGEKGGGRAQGDEIKIPIQIQEAFLCIFWAPAVFVLGLYFVKPNTTLGYNPIQAHSVGKESVFSPPKPITCTGSLSHLRTMLPESSSCPSLPNGPIMQLSPYLTRKPGIFMSSRSYISKLGDLQHLILIHEV